MDWKGLRDWISTGATLLAVIVALFGADIRRLWRRPKLKAMVRPDSQDHSMELTLNDAGYFLRLWIENRGNERAEKVQVFLAAVKRKQADGTYRLVHQFLSMNLRWAHESSPTPEVFADVISPGIGRQCNVGGVFKSQPAEFTLWTEAGPSSKSHVLSPGTYRLEVKIASANAPPVRHDFELSFNGKWFDDIDNVCRRHWCPSTQLRHRGCLCGPRESRPSIVARQCD